MPPPQNLIKLKQLHLPSLSGYITGIAYIYANSGDLNLSGYFIQYISGASGYLSGVILNSSGFLQSQIDAINNSGSSLHDLTFNITSGQDVVYCPFGDVYSTRPTITLGNSGSGPIMFGQITNYANTGIRVGLTDYARDDKYYITIHF